MTQEERKKRASGWNLSMPIVGADAEKFDKLLERSKLKPWELAVRCFILGLELLYRREYGKEGS